VVTVLTPGIFYRIFSTFFAASSVRSSDAESGATVGLVTGFVTGAATSQPYYYDYWVSTVYEGDTIYVDGKPISKEGVVSSAYKNTLTDEGGPILGALDRESQLVAWRLGQDGKTVIETGIFNLTKDVAPAAVHFDANNTQT
jgi:hypothetical protein